MDISPNLKLILAIIKTRCTEEAFANRSDFKALLSTSASEKYVIATTFCRLPWNIGSLGVLAVLQELRVLTATEFILSLEQSDEIQLILNDFLEAEYELLGNLFITSNLDVTNGIKLNAILDECLIALFADLLKNSSLNDLGYLKGLKTLLPHDVLLKVTLKHVDTILELHKTNIKSSFANFSSWINEGVDSIDFTKVLQKTLFCTFEQEVVKHILKISTRDQFKGWKFYLILLQTIAFNCKAETSTFIRKYLKSRLREIAIVPNKHLVLHMLLTVRAATATTTDIQKNIDAYADWYRQNIAEMKFVLKPEEFQCVCGILEECVSYEMEEYYLEIHAKISISPPVLCGKLVQGYKSKCKIRLSQIKNQNPEREGNGDNSIIIESD